MQLNIRRATIEDYEEICRLFAEGDAVHTHALPDRFRGTYPARTKAFLEHWYAHDAAGIFVAEVTNQVVGFVQCSVMTTPERPMLYERTFVSVDSLIVQERYRRQGIGRRLMERVHTWARERGIREIELNVFEFNDTAIRLYEQLGYRTISRRMHRRVD